MIFDKLNQVAENVKTLLIFDEILTEFALRFTFFTMSILKTVVPRVTPCAQSNGTLRTLIIQTILLH